MAASLAFELLKLYKRPAIWVLGMILVLAVILLGYVQNYVFYESVREGFIPIPVDSEDLRDYILPKGLPTNVTNLLAMFGGPIALILGALSAGSEYGWGTLKTALTQGLGRIGIFASKFVAVGLAIVAFVLLSFAVGALSGYVVANLLGESAEWPPAGEALQGLGAACLILWAWASLGFFLALLFRGTALAIGLGLVYGFILETLTLSLLEQSGSAETVEKALLSRNSVDLVSSLVGVPPQFAGMSASAEPARAALVLAAYVVVPLLISAVLFRRRDVTS